MSTWSKCHCHVLKAIKLHCSICPFPELDQEKAMDQSPPETDKQPLIGAEPPRPMLAPEVHLQPRSLAPPGPQQYPPQYEQAPFGTLNASIFKFQAEETRV